MQGECCAQQTSLPRIPYELCRGESYWPVYSLLPPRLHVVTPPSGRGLVIPVFTPPSGRGLAILLFYPAVRTGSSNAPFYPAVRNTPFYPAVRTGSSNTRFFFFFFFLSWSVAPDLRSVKTILAGKLCSFSVYSPEFS